MNTEFISTSPANMESMGFFVVRQESVPTPSETTIPIEINSDTTLPSTTEPILAPENTMPPSSEPNTEVHGDAAFQVICDGEDMFILIDVNKLEDFQLPGNCTFKPEVISEINDEAMVNVTDDNLVLRMPASEEISLPVHDSLPVHESNAVVSVAPKLPETGTAFASETIGAGSATLLLGAALTYISRRQNKTS